jgi:peroxiredoxin
MIPHLVCSNLEDDIVSQESRHTLIGGAILLLTAFIAGAEPAAFKSLDVLQAHFETRLAEAQRAIATERFAALERLLSGAAAEERSAVLLTMMDTAMFLERFERVLQLSDDFLKSSPDHADGWDVRRLRSAALIELGRAVQARDEWDRASQPVDREDWQPSLEAGMQIAEGLTDARRADDAKALYEVIKKRFAFAGGIDGFVNPRIDDLDWIGKTPPTLDGKDQAGRTTDLAEYRGKVVLIDFWATWCQPCLVALPELMEIYEAQHQAGFEVIGVSLDNDAKALEQFLGKNPLPWRIVHDPQGGSARRYQVTGIPATFLIDRRGKIARAGSPAGGFDALVRRLLAEPATPEKP